MTATRLPCQLISALLLSLLAVLFIVPFVLSGAAAQDLEKPLQNIDDEITAFRFSPDGRIAYSTKRTIKTKKYDLQHDDIWIQDSNGKRRRILQGDKFTRGSLPFSYAVDDFHWSPNSRELLAQLFTTSVIDESGRTQDSFVTLALEDSGKEIRLGKGESTIQDCYDATWLNDNSTIVCLNEAIKPRLLFSFRYYNIVSGPAGPIFEGRTFLDYGRIPGTNSAIAVERDRAMSGPPRLQRLELLAQDATEVATLDDYAGGLSVSPSGTKVAYFIDREILEVRDLTAPDHFVRLRVGLGVFHWAQDETRILLKRAVERKSADIVWIAIPPLPPEPAGKEIPVLQPTPQPIFHDVTFREFAISPDGRFLGVVLPGKRNLMIFHVPD